MTREYNKTEIDLMLKNIKDNHVGFDKKLDEILEQTKKTNGRVSKLENWRAYLVGAWAVVSLVVIPAFTYVYFQDQRNLDERIVDNQKEIKELLKNY